NRTSTRSKHSARRAKRSSRARLVEDGVWSRQHMMTAVCPAGRWNDQHCKRLLADINQGLIDVVVVYKVDRLTRSLADFAKMVEGDGLTPSHARKGERKYRYYFSRNFPAQG